MSGNLVTPPQGYVPEPIFNIQRICLNVISDMEDYGAKTSNYRRLENMAVRYYRTKFRGFNAPSLVSVNTNVDNVTRVWAFPPDYIRYTKIAYNINGRLWTLGCDESINLSNSPQICQTPIQSSPVVIGGYWMAGGIWNGYQTAYATGGGFNINYYRVYETEGYIQFAQSLPVGRAVVEYLSAGRGVNGMTLIPIAFEYAFDKYLKWQFCMSKKDLVRLGKEYQEQYELAMFDARSLMGKNPQEYMDEWYRASGFKLR